MEPIASWGRQRGPAAAQWSLHQHPTHFALHTNDAVTRYAAEKTARLSVQRRWLRWHLRVESAERPLILRGLRAADAAQLDQALHDANTRHQLDADLGALVTWTQTVRTVVDAATTDQRWIPEETIRQFETSRPDRYCDIAQRAQTAAHLLTEDEREALRFPANREALRTWVAETNEWILTRELASRRTFLDTIERSPLTEEQARAVVCYDNRVHVIAAAGSGKTSVMVGRAAYAISRRFTAADGILLLAFNKAAAHELQERIDSRLHDAGIDPTGIRADTFHAFGLAVIGQATGRKPRVAAWVTDGQDTAMVSRIVDELRDASVDFRFKWDLFRLLYARTTETPEETIPDAWDPQRRRTGLRTFRGEVVKSEGERLIADWLYLNGVDYRYEQPYLHDTTDTHHSQYRPDFYYPKIDAWHEHWALDEHGNPPDTFTGYTESMRWKQQLHQLHGTNLIETTWAEVMHHDGLAKLGAELTDLGLDLDWNPERPIPGEQPVRHEDLARLMRTFMTHVKSNSLTEEHVQNRAAHDPRSKLFLDLYWQIHHQWNQRLSTDGSIDFEDMLVQAAHHIETGRYTSPHQLVMVDEFQDASQARARLTRALVNQPGRYLLAVGDDWQSINRFAGADITVLTNFNQWFGPGPTLRLQTTFRCTQTIADAASGFVAKNPQQLTKQVRASRHDPGTGVQVLRVPTREDIPAAISDYLEHLAETHDETSPRPASDGPLTVDILGRYHFDQRLLPAHRPTGPHVTFRTVHSAKGLEADYIIVPNMTNGTYGFPSQIADDPVLNLVMADPDAFPHAEERRLFYVALTRARHGVLLIAPTGLESPFLAELLKDGQAQPYTPPGQADRSQSPEALVCPTCGTGMLIPRSGPYGRFLGCSSFPRCRHTTPLR